MITNFEKITEELSSEEQEISKIIMKGLSARTKRNPIKACDIVTAMNQSVNLVSTITGEKLLKKPFTEVRLRKISNYIRANGLVPLIATSAGYYVSTDREEIEKQIRSLEERARSIQRSADGLKAFIK